MFLALRDIRFAKGRFALMTAVVALVTLLLVVLSALTRGLGQQSTSAVESLPAGSVLLASSGSTTTWSDSTITAAQVHSAVAAAPGSEPLAVARARAVQGDDTTSLAVFGAAPDGRAMAQLNAPLADGQVVLPRDTADALHLAQGQSLALNGLSLQVAGIQDTQWYSHSPVAWTTLATANRLTHADAGQATAVLVPASSDAAAAARAAQLDALTGSAITGALPGYRSEHGSLLMIQAFLYAISALVVVAFLSVWTIQRTRDIAVLRALGGSRRYVLADSLGQAAILLAIGTVLGAAVGTAVALAVRAAVPVLVLASTTVLPAAGVALVGLAGSVVAVRRVRAIDPMIALGGN